MRFGKWRGVPCALAVAAIMGLGSGAVRADGWHLHDTIPREVPAYDFTTGGEYYAPPIPYGHYAKDYHAEAAKAAGMVAGTAKGLFDKTLGLFHGLGSGNGCGAGGCGGNGCGHGLGSGCGNGNENGNGSGCGFCAGRGLFHGAGCGAGNGDGPGSCGLFGKGGCGLANAGLGAGCGSGTGHGLGLGHKKHFAPCHASTVAATSQAVPVATAQSLCGDPGCKIGGIHSHIGNLMNKIRCRFCGGGGCGGCGGAGLGSPCGGCGGKGLLGGLGHGGGCGLCGGSGLCKGGNCGNGNGSGTGCGLCGGQGCANCLKGMASKAHGVLGHLAGSAMGLFHHNKFDYFVGPGGPVPMTPGYVPYIVTTRSPREFFAFPPMNPNVP